MELLGRRGGCRQRAERAEQARAAALLQSAVASFLVQEWAWGRMTPQQCQKIATLLRADLEASASGTLDMGTVDFLKGLGTAGRNPQHMHSQLMKKFSPESALRPSPFNAILKSGKTGIHFKDLDGLWPHVLFSRIYHEYPKAWEKLVCPSMSALRKFWDDVKNSKQYLNHPIRFRQHHQRLAVPISIHGDGTPVTGLGKSWGKLCDIWSWTSLVTTGQTELTYFVIFTVFTGIQASSLAGKTLTQFWKKLKWSLEALWHGKWPEVDENGLAMPPGSKSGDLAGGHYACLWALIGDLDYMWKGVGLPNCNNLSKPCGWCPANNSTMPWYDFRPNAAWVQNVFTEAQWRAQGMDACNPLFQLPGVSILTCAPDWMHVKHLGLDKRLLGSALYALTHYIMPGSPEQNLEKLQREIFDIYKSDDVKTRFSNLQLSMFSLKAKGNLRGKAAEIKCLGPVLLKIWDKHASGQVSIYQKIRLMLHLNVLLDEKIDAVDNTAFCLPRDVREDIANTCHSLLMLWTDVQEFFSQETDAGEMFHFTVKAHFLLHCCLIESSPRRLWCYRGEDLMQKMRRLIFSCSKRSTAWQVGNKSIGKYCVALERELAAIR